MSELTLYLAPGTCAMAVRIALVEAGAPHQIKRLDLAAGEQRTPAYLAINPKGRVPALVTERGVLTETPALLLYVAQRFPNAGLAPLDDPFLLARMQEVHSFLVSTIHVAHAHGRRPGRWVLGERFSLADIYLFVIAGWLESDGVAISEFPKVADHTRRMLARPAVQQALLL